MSKCCGCNKKVLSNAVANNTDSCTCSLTDNCTDVCVTPQCGDPKLLTVLVPVIYDEIGINVCRTIPLATLPVTGVVYLPSATTDPEYDEDTNPTSVTMQLFAPYGVTYTDTTAATPNLNFIGFLSTNGAVAQGLNLMAMSKVLNFDIASAEMTVGLTLIVKSIYYNQYRIPHNGKAIVSKGTLASPEESVCMSFVSGSLLDRNIKPLELCNPLDQKRNCESCTDPDDCTCLTPSD